MPERNQEITWGAGILVIVASLVLRPTALLWMILRELKLRKEGGRDKGTGGKNH